MIVEKISKHVLTVGENYQNYRGGIAGVINTYSKYFSVFKFVPTYKPQPHKLIGIPYFAYNFVSLFFKLLIDREIRIVHIHGAAKGSVFRKYFVFLLAKYVFRRKVLYHCHGSEIKNFYRNSNSLFKWIIQHFISHVDLLICLSKHWEEFFRENFKVRNIIVLENIVEPASEKKQLRKITLPLKVLYLGYIGNRKGIFDLLDVLREHRESFEGQMELIVGGNGEIKRLEDYLNTHNLHSLVKYEGWVAGEKKQRLLAESDVFILPSYNEGLPLSILEAMSYNMPIISTPVGGITEIVLDNVNGFIVNPGDKFAIYDRLKKIVESPEIIQDMGKESGKLVVPYYAESVIPKLESIYHRILTA
jgi:glycosyltransferase involved in cell wall biosynthesis